MRRYLKKIGTDMIFGYTPSLAARKNMVECNAKGEVIVSHENIQKTSGLSSISAFRLGMSFMMAGEKTLKSWVEDNIIEVNAAGIDIQGMIIEKWQKHYGSEPMPSDCLFVVSGNPGDD